jgi:hypothetical protein
MEECPAFRETSGLMPTQFGKVNLRELEPAKGGAAITLILDTP